MDSANVFFSLASTCPNSLYFSIISNELLRNNTRQEIDKGPIVLAALKILKNYPIQDLWYSHNIVCGPNFPADFAENPSLKTPLCFL